MSNYVKNVNNTIKLFHGILISTEPQTSATEIQESGDVRVIEGLRAMYQALLYEPARAAVFWVCRIVFRLL